MKLNFSNMKLNLDEMRLNLDEIKPNPSNMKLHIGDSKREKELMKNPGGCCCGYPGTANLPIGSPRKKANQEIGGPREGMHSGTAPAITASLPPQSKSVYPAVPASWFNNKQGGMQCLDTLL